MSVVPLVPCIPMLTSYPACHCNLSNDGVVLLLLTVCGNLSWWQMKSANDLSKSILQLYTSPLIRIHVIVMNNWLSHAAIKSEHLHREWHSAECMNAYCIKMAGFYPTWTAILNARLVVTKDDWTLSSLWQPLMKDMMILRITRNHIWMQHSDALILPGLTEHTVRWGISCVRGGCCIWRYRLQGSNIAHTHHSANNAKGGKNPQESPNCRGCALPSGWRNCCPS